MANRAILSAVEIVNRDVGMRSKKHFNIVIICESINEIEKPALNFRVQVVLNFLKKEHSFLTVFITEIKEGKDYKKDRLYTTSHIR